LDAPEATVNTKTGAETAVVGAAKAGLKWMIKFGTGLADGPL